MPLLRLHMDGLRARRRGGLGAAHRYPARCGLRTRGHRSVVRYRIATRRRCRGV
ncbi:hypothetical protein [Candidatus Synechococcus spongiarum]|uniref:hypothetical protein n=1 Tax=Candidatus Synechococcus spongiarum TaxID=431041 RepID=UPI0015D67048|nr:hypothetical protein [Candidatus Synechococcus spongiarum]